MVRHLAGIVLFLGLSMALLPVGCSDDDGAGAGGDPGPVIPVGGSGGAPVDDPSRGAPEEFPADCYTECDLACARLAWCGGDGSSLYPLEEEECLSRCANQEDGYMWPDISGNFKCCTSQESCGDVMHCGGWLAHPDPVPACERMCECFFNSAIEQLVAALDPPTGYRFAPDLLMVDPGATAIDWASIPGVELYREGRYPVVRLARSATPTVVTELGRWGRVLPTFLDGAGRVSAAVGNVVLVVEQPERRAAALEVAARHGFGTHRILKTKLRGEPAARLHVLEGRDGWKALDAVAELSKLPGVRAELDQLRFYEKRYTPDDPSYPDQWHLHNTGQNGSTPSVDGRVDEAWDVTFGDPQVLIAINDDGVDLNHPDLAAKLEPELNYPANWQDLMEDPTNPMGFAWHGTAVAGVAGAIGDNAEGGVGVCPGCRIIPHMYG
ncbi:MAG: S8 family serine peptidase, partial [Deltaproteobacteria bacterium]|nr:S8 family serine peptidase [Deltaproteobacteria bacterium]MBW2536253.1 S8 family serine peptidase [Deltaproteobacteria bacterium]